MAIALVVISYPVSSPQSYSLSLSHSLSLSSLSLSPSSKASLSSLVSCTNGRTSGKGRTRRPRESLQIYLRDRIWVGHGSSFSSSKHGDEYDVSSLLLLPVPPLSLSLSLSCVPRTSVKKINGEWMFRFLHFVKQREPFLRNGKKHSYIPNSM